MYMKSMNFVTKHKAHIGGCRSNPPTTLKKVQQVVALYLYISYILSTKIVYFTYSLHQNTLFARQAGYRFARTMGRPTVLSLYSFSKN